MSARVEPVIEPIEEATAQSVYQHQPRQYCDEDDSRHSHLLPVKERTDLAYQEATALSSLGSLMVSFESGQASFVISHNVFYKTIICLELLKATVHLLHFGW